MWDVVVKVTFPIKVIFRGDKASPRLVAAKVKAYFSHFFHSSLTRHIISSDFSELACVSNDDLSCLSLPLNSPIEERKKVRSLENNQFSNHCLCGNSSHQSKQVIQVI